MASPAQHLHPRVAQQAGGVHQAYRSPPQPERQHHPLVTSALSHHLQQGSPGGTQAGCAAAVQHSRGVVQPTCVNAGAQRRCCCTEVGRAACEQAFYATCLWCAASELPLEDSRTKLLLLQAPTGCSPARTCHAFEELNAKSVQAAGDQKLQGPGGITGTMFVCACMQSLAPGACLWGAGDARESWSMSVGGWRCSRILEQSATGSKGPYHVNGHTVHPWLPALTMPPVP